ncbi:MAG TPA: DUF4258 domain-containing protein [Candidatus Hydrogenedentes bacterium]|nr:DUF4258 domain-containing protein [Candidatus Hydrogenedentota bacterium]
MDWLTPIRECFDVNRVYYTQHARREMEAEESGPVLDEGVCQAVLAGEVIREYADDKPYPSVLILGSTHDRRPLHIVCAYDAEEDRAFIVTVYQPDPVQWIDYRTRRTP